MKRVHLFVHNEPLEKREYIAGLLDQIPEVVTWRYDMRSCFYIVSEATAKDLATAIQAKSGNTLSRFIVVPIESEYWGWATDETWYLFANKAHKPQ